MNSTIYLLNKWCNADIKRANRISLTWTLASDLGPSPTFTFCFSSLTGQLLHRPHKDYPVQVVRWLVPAHLHQPRAGLVHLPPQHADWVGLHLGAQTPTAIRGPAAPTPRWCLRTQLGPSQGARLADALEATWLGNMSCWAAWLFDIISQGSAGKSLCLFSGRVEGSKELSKYSWLDRRVFGWVFKLNDLDRHQAVRPNAQCPMQHLPEGFVPIQLMPQRYPRGRYRYLK